MITASLRWSAGTPALARVFRYRAAVCSIGLTSDGAAGAAAMSNNTRYVSAGSGTFFAPGTSFAGSMFGTGKDPEDCAPRRAMQAVAAASESVKRRLRGVMMTSVPATVHRKRPTEADTADAPDRSPCVGILRRELESR